MSILNTNIQDELVRMRTHLYKVRLYGASSRWLSSLYFLGRNDHREDATLFTDHLN